MALFQEVRMCSSWYKYGRKQDTLEVRRRGGRMKRVGRGTRKANGTKKGMNGRQQTRNGKKAAKSKKEGKREIVK